MQSFDALYHNCFETEMLILGSFLAVSHPDHTCENKIKQLVDMGFQAVSWSHDFVLHQSATSKIWNGMMLEWLWNVSELLVSQWIKWKNQHHREARSLLTFHHHSITILSSFHSHHSIPYFRGSLNQSALCRNCTFVKNLTTWYTLYLPVWS